MTGRVTKRINIRSTARERYGSHDLQRTVVSLGADVSVLAQVRGGGMIFDLREPYPCDNDFDLTGLPLAIEALLVDLRERYPGRVIELPDGTDDTGDTGDSTLLRRLQEPT